MDQRHKAVFRQFRFATVADGDFGRAFHIHAAVVAREGVTRQIFYRAARFHAANGGAPAVLFKGTVDVGRHRVGRVGPVVVAVVRAVGFFFEVEAVHRVGADAVRQTRQEARHDEAQIARIFRFAQAAPGSVLGVLEDFGQVARVRQLLPGFHLHHAWRGAGDERAVRRRANARHFAQQLHILRAVVEVVVAHQAAKRLATELAILFFVDFFEDRALVPAHALKAFQGAAQFLLGDAHKADFQHLVGFRVVDQIVQATPGAFQLLELLVVNNLVNLLGQFLVDTGNQVLNGAVGVVREGHGVFQRLLGQGFYRVFDGGTRLVGFRAKLFAEQRAEFILAERLLRLQLLLLRRIAHRLLLVTFGAIVIFRHLAQRFEQRRVLKHFRDKLFGTVFTVHVGQQVRELSTGFQQLVQRLDLTRDGVRQEVVHAVESEIDVQFAFAGQGVVHLERHARLERFHTLVEVVDINFKEFTFVHRRLRIDRLPDQVGKHAHYKRKLNFAFRTVDFHVVLDLHARRAVTGDKFLPTVTHWHDVLHRRCAVKFRQRASCLPP
ncbi:hypothetical protein ESA_03940 [Cronobacter sakazakii ATCC BAA-894]|uniref:Uncharacterized protein n=1 Tax=Cronobacter sakazakii (strain ATCC BAA-894) TaxID=290339 RepID=A7MQ05_CROS8|nr:hypothetical protein ESA_03940 [Cronobacter sakazakii ATCC BAA-894]